MEHAERYLFIQQKKLGKRLEYSIQVPSDIHRQKISSGITGIEAARMIPASNPEINIYVFASQAASLIIQNAFKDSVYHLIEKPVTKWQMNKLLKHYETDHEDTARSQFAELSEIL